MFTLSLHLIDTNLPQYGFSAFSTRSSRSENILPNHEFISIRPESHTKQQAHPHTENRRGIRKHAVVLKEFPILFAINIFLLQHQIYAMSTCAGDTHRTDRPSEQSVCLEFSGSVRPTDKHAACYCVRVNAGQKIPQRR